MVFAPIIIDTNMRDLFVPHGFVIRQPQSKVLLVVIILVKNQIVVESLGYLENDFLFVTFFIVGVNQHELVVVCHVEVLLYLFIGVDVLLYFDFFLLDGKLSILVF